MTIPGLRLALASRFDAIRAGFDIRDVFLLVGPCLLCYGLYLLRPWLGFAVGGLLVTLYGLLMLPKGSR